MADQNTQERLREGIEAARRGDKLTARRLLQQVLLQDRGNEAALMWMASVMDTVAERRAYLERALQLNPDNERAREALERLGAAGPSAVLDNGASQTGRGRNPYLLAAGVVAVLMVIIIAVVALSSVPPSNQTVQSTFAAVMNASITSTPDNVTVVAPTATFYGIVNTLDAALVELPPTFTPEPSQTPTTTPRPTGTPPPISDFSLIYSDFIFNRDIPSLYGAESGDETLLSAAEAFFDIALSPDGEQIAFVRVPSQVSEADSDEEAEAPPAELASAPQLFVASLQIPDQFTQLTSLIGTIMTHPDFSPDGSQIVFSSDADGDEELYTVSSSGGDVTQLTNNEAVDTTASFSPDGSVIVFTSDVESPGFREIYSYEVEGGTITRLTDDQGNNFAASFSPDGTEIVYLSDKNGDADIYVMDSTGSRSRQLTPDDSGAEDRAPTWSPDGRWVAFASNRESENFSWYAVNVTTLEVVQLTENDRNAQSLIFQAR